MGHQNHGRSAAEADITTGQAVFSERLAIGRPLGSSPPPRPSAAESAQDHQWLETWQRNEIRWLNNKVEELEGRLRWRTITLGSALALSMLTAGAAAAWAVALLYRDHPGATQATLATPSANQVAPIATAAEDRIGAADPETGSPLGDRVASLPADDGAEQPAQFLAFQAEQALDALIEETSPGTTAAGSTSMPTDESTQSPASATDEAVIATAAEGTQISHQASALEPAAGTAPERRRDPVALGGAGRRPEYYLSTAPVNLRTGPTTAAATLVVVAEGGLVTLIGREGSWLQVEYSVPDAESVTGWVHSEYLRRIPRPEEDGP